MKSLIALPLLGILAAAAPAQNADNDAPRARQIVIYGNDPCPAGAPDELVVCARRPETERLRVPANLRETPPDAADDSWAARAESLEALGDTGIGSCSTVGPGGATGCLQQSIERSESEKRSAGTDPQTQ